jgi:hypothetical protein
VTFCPLCNTALTFDRRVDGEVRRFGVSGLLRFSDLIMFDYTNESLWQQVTGEAIVGEDAGKRLDFVASSIVAWSDFLDTHPGGLVLSKETGHSRVYGQNPYQGYDRHESLLFPSPGANDDRLQAKERVLTVEQGETVIAFPFSELEQHLVMTASIGEREVVAFWQPGTASALDDLVIRDGRDVGAAAAYSPLLDGERLTFEARDGRIVDAGTGSTWNVLGHATEGPLAGSQLEPVTSANHLWFAWAAFKPDTKVIRGG